MAANEYERRAAGVQERIVITGTLVLTCPASLSNGDVEGLTDITLRRDPVKGQPVLPGTSLAGALRGYLNQRLEETGTEALDPVLIARLFGGVAEHTSRQSWLFVDDAYGQEPGVELRDGVAINPVTRIAAEKKKFDIELLPAGTTFDLRFEFWEPASPKQPDRLRRLLALALTALEKGDIRLGGRKRRGFGECKVENWQVYRYDMSTISGILGWLEQDISHPELGATLVDKLGVTSIPNPALSLCHLRAAFDLESSLLIRAGPSEPTGPDMVHLRNTAGEPVLSGTSVAGALRARARRIVRLLRPDDHDSFINAFFGQEMKPGERVLPKASRLWVRETIIKPRLKDWVQSRVKLDRFTGGSYPGALFDQQPVWGGEVCLHVTLQRPREIDVRPTLPEKATQEEIESTIKQRELAEIGLLLLLLKDLWTGDLPLGGEASVGRGRLKGKWAELEWQGAYWRIEAVVGETGNLRITGDRQMLEDAVQALATSATKEVAR